MKFALLFITGLCTIAVQSSSIRNEPYLNDITELAAGDSLLERLREFIEKVIAHFQEVIGNIIAEAKAIVSGIIEKIQSVIEESKEAVKRIIKQVLDKLEELAKQNEVARACVEANRPALEAALEKYSTEIEVCSSNAIAQSKNILEDIQPHIDAIKSNIAALEIVINTCIESNSNPLQIIQCVGKEVNTIRDEILSLIKNAKNAVTAASLRAVEIFQENQNCVQNTYLNLETEVKAVVDAVEKCIDEGNSEEKPELLIM